MHIPEEEWAIFENTHPAIIDRHTFAVVQEFRSHKRRPTREGKQSMFSGLLYCADCGAKMYFCTAKNFKHQFIAKVVVHEPYRKDKRRHQELDIYYRGVGLVHIPDPDEMERLYQESTENNEKTA